MSTLSIDVEKIKTAGEELKVIAKEYNNVINELYTKINNIQNSGIWTSESSSGSANTFIQGVLKDKPSSQALATNMNDLGNKMVNYANSIKHSSDNKL